MSTAAAEATIRIFVVDDSRIVRRLLIGLLEKEPDFRVVGEAESGPLALERIPGLEPDVVTMDVNMPGLDGVSTLKALRAKLPGLQVVMFSSVTQSGARITLDALEAGAADIATKPSAERGPEAFRESIADLILKLRAVAHQAKKRKASPGLSASYTPFLTGPPAQTTRRNAIDLVVLASSTGGPNALVTLVGALPRGLPVPLMVVQHMPAFFTNLLAQRLDALGGPPVREAADAEVPLAGTILVAPGERHLGLARDGDVIRTRLSDGPRENGCRPSADVLFRDAAQVFGPSVLAVVLTGMGTDGERGCERIRGAGGRVIAQDEETSAVWGMPGAVVRAGYAEAVLPLDAIADAIVSRVSRRRAGTLPG
jgi:two-component system chemotaxis response regulator CheB